jgi:tetratricopeptide (TPR) repeat protein
MDSVVNVFPKIAPYLTHPLVLIGFVLLLAFSIHRTLIKSGIILPLSQRSGIAAIQLLLRYGFWLALVVIVLGVGLRFFEVQAKKDAGSSVIQSGGDAAVTVTADAGGTVVTQTGDGVVIIHKIAGISPEEYRKLAEELGVTEAALANFFRMLEHEHVPPDELDEALRDIAKRYKELEQELAGFTSDDPAVTALREAAREALNVGELERAEARFREALLEAASSAADLGARKAAELAYAEAALYYQKAAEFVPEGGEEILAEYLDWEGVLWLQAGRYADAEPPLMRALEIREEVLARTYSALAQSLNNVGMLYQSRGHYDEAEPLLKQALEIREQVLEPTSDALAQSLNNLAKLYDEQGRYAETEPLYKRALEIRKVTLGPEHFKVGLLLHNLASLYLTEGRYDEAEPLFKHALRIAENALGLDHPDVAMSLDGLGILYRSQKQYEKAEPLFTRALGIAERVFGPEHPQVAACLNSLGTLYVLQGWYADWLLPTSLLTG